MVACHRPAPASTGDREFCNAPAWSKASIMIILRPPCPACQTRTMLALITPGPSGFDIRTFKCPACDHVHQCVVELVDPMKSPEALGWLLGDLRAPA